MRENDEASEGGAHTDVLLNKKTQSELRSVRNDVLTRRDRKLAFSHLVPHRVLFVVYVSSSATKVTP